MSVSDEFGPLRESLRPQRELILVEGRGVVAGAGDAEDVLGGVAQDELGGKIGHEEHGAGGPRAHLLPHHHTAQVGQLHQEIQRYCHLRTNHHSSHQNTVISILHSQRMHAQRMHGRAQIAYACTQPVRMRRVDGQQCAGCILPEYEAALETFLKPLLRGSTFTSARELLADRVRSVRLQVSSQSRLDSTILQNSSWSPLTPIL